MENGRSRASARRRRKKLLLQGRGALSGPSVDEPDGSESEVPRHGAVGPGAVGSSSASLQQSMDGSGIESTVDVPEVPVTLTLNDLVPLGSSTSSLFDITLVLQRLHLTPCADCGQTGMDSVTLRSVVQCAACDRDLATGLFCVTCRCFWCIPCVTSGRGSLAGHFVGSIQEPANIARVATAVGSPAPSSPLAISFSVTIGPIHSGSLDVDPELTAAIADAVGTGIWHAAGEFLCIEEGEITFANEGASAVFNFTIVLPEGVEVSSVFFNLNAGIESTLAADIVRNIQELDNIASVAGDDMTASLGIPQIGPATEAISAPSLCSTQRAPSTLGTEDLAELAEYYCGDS